MACPQPTSSGTVVPFLGVAATKVVAPGRAATANAGDRGNLPFVPQRSQEKFNEPLGYHSAWGPSGGTGRWVAGNANILTSQSNCRRGKSAGNVTQIVMFPTPTHAVRPATGTAEGSRSTPLPQVPEQRHLQPNARLSSSAPVLAAITPVQLPEQRSRAPSLRAPVDTGVRHRHPRFGPAAAAAAQVHTLSDDSSEGADSEGSEELSMDPFTKDSSGQLRRSSSCMTLNDRIAADHRRRTFHTQASSKTINELGEEWHPSNCDSRRASCGLLKLPHEMSPRGNSSRHSKDPNAQEHRESLRKAILRASGCGCESTFRAIDLNQNGTLSMQEFGDGMSRLCVDWQEATGRNSIKEVYKLVAGKDGSIRLQDLFPDTQHAKSDEPSRMSTPEFWNHWCKSNPKEAAKKRGPKWQAADQDEELQCLFASTQSRQEVIDRKRWMSQTIRRMHKQGKSDARCREMCATHLPRGTGMRDKDYVHTFSQTDVKGCRRSYADAVSIPLRNIQKQVFAMREQRMELQHSRMVLSRMNQRSVRAARKQVNQNLRRSHTAGGLVTFCELDPDEDDYEEEEEDPLEVSAGDPP